MSERIEAHRHRSPQEHPRRIGLLAVTEADGREVASARRRRRRPSMEAQPQYRGLVGQQFVEVVHLVIPGKGACRALGARSASQRRQSEPEVIVRRRRPRRRPQYPRVAGRRRIRRRVYSFVAVGTMTTP
jgi:hypothetical protein